MQALEAGIAGGQRMILVRAEGADATLCIHLRPHPAGTGTESAEGDLLRHAAHSTLLVQQRRELPAHLLGHRIEVFQVLVPGLEIVRRHLVLAEHEPDWTARQRRGLVATAADRIAEAA